MYTVIQVAAILTVVFSFMSRLDTAHHSIALLAHFRLQYFALSVALLICCVLLRHFAFAGALALTAAFNAKFVLPWYLARVPVADGAPLKFIHVNVWSGNTHYDRLCDLVDKEQPDLIFLQEVTDEWIAGTSQLLEKYPYTYLEPRLGNFGVAVYSRVPFASVRHVDSPPLDYPILVATILIHDEPLTFISAHPTIPVGRRLFEIRKEQLKGVAELVQQVSGKRVLLGDFNTSLWESQFRRLESTTGLKNVRCGFGILPSWPVFLPFAMIPIDHALVSHDLGIADVRTGRRIGSDHLPLVVTLVV
jgi:endonuclease/exonuclease/phosphatase (EEP) superfamily protein YafD